MAVTGKHDSEETWIFAPVTNLPLAIHAALAGHNTLRIEPGYSHITGTTTNITGRSIKHIAAPMLILRWLQLFQVCAQK